MLRRHPLLVAVGLLLVAAATALAFAIASFDLNNYRSMLSGRLSQEMGVPVSLGEARFALHQGINLDFSNVRIGDETSEYDLHAEHLFLRLKLRPLLQRQISFSAIEVLSPTVRIHSSPATKTLDESSAPFSILSLLHETEVKLLTIRDGQFHWQWLSDTQKSEAASYPRLTNIDLTLDDIGPDTTTRAQFKAELHPQDSEPVRLEAEVEVTPADNWADWRKWHGKIDLQARHLDPALFLKKHLSVSNLGGSGDLTVSAQGSVREGLDLRMALAGLHFSAVDGAQFLPFVFESSGRAEFRDNIWNLSLSTARLNDLSLKGSLVLEVESEHPEKAQLRGDLSSNTFAAATLHHIFAALGADDTLDALQDTGSLTVEKLRLDGPIRTASDAGLRLTEPLRYAAVRAENLKWDTAAGPVEKNRLQLVYEDNQLKITQGNFVWQEIPWSLSGRIEKFAPGKEPLLNLRGEARTDIRKLTRLLPELIPPELSLKGQAAIALRITENFSSPEVNLDSDLTEVEIGWGKAVRKPPGMPTTLGLQGTLEGEKLQIRGGHVAMEGLKANFEGEVALKDTTPFRFLLQLSQYDLAKLEQLLPAVEDFRLQGTLSGDLLLSGTRDRLAPPEGEFTLREGGAHFFNVVADLNHTQGEIFLSGHSVNAPKLKTYLGESPFDVAAQISDLADFCLLIDLEGQNLRPQDLIFRGGKTNLTSVYGQMAIDAEGIYFTHVHARTGGGTRAAVSGGVHGYSKPRVELSIDAEYGNVDEILEFYSGPPRQVGRKKEEAGQTEVDIKVKVEAGTFHKVEFAQAAADIHYQAGILRVYPLHADLAPGYYVGRIVWAEPPGNTALLKVTGHLEDVNAEEAQNIQSDAPGLITGTLRGDFYLEGDGRNFIETSRGGLALEAHNGVLRRFNVLSKVFSLLNVAQIFSFQLPDMAREGMPYQKITASFSLRKGVLASEDLLVDSNAINMSMVGEIDLVNNEIDAVLGVKPLQTVDSVISKIPIAGWILNGEDESLIMTHFRVKGDRRSPEVEAIPITSISEKVRGVFRRVLGLPAKVFSDLEKATQ